MKLSDFFQQKETAEATHDWTLVNHDHSLAQLDYLAEFLADKILRVHCDGSPHLYEAWKRSLTEGKPLSPTEHRALSKGFIEPAFGLPGQNFDTNHLQGFIAQYLWYFLIQEISVEPIKRIERVGFAATDHGGDGMVVHQIAAGYLMFRLWEIKKCVGEAPVSSTINTAYGQLSSKAEKYLARLTTIGQELKEDSELAEFYSKLPEIWIEAGPEASIGVAVAVNANNVPAKCFTTLGDRFPKLLNPKRLRGILTAIEDFPSFCGKVQQAIWKGL